ncbi:MAG: signal recognition particle-docking protein FtsY, partial [Methylococcales bacterium]|nr:signal recognition particle-docking protein FtsY [Methylococcales bacterium]
PWQMEGLLKNPLLFLNYWKMPYLWGLMILNLVVMMVAGWRASLPYARVTLTAFLALGVLSLQIASSYWVFKTQGMPLAITLDILLGMWLFWSLCRLFVRINPAIKPRPQKAALRYFSFVGIVLLFSQILGGVWSSANTTGLMCKDFPRCNEQWMPQADFISGFNFLNAFLNNSLGQLSFDAQLAIHWSHRVGGLLTFIILIVLMIKATSDGQSKPIRKAGLWLSILLLIELALGTFSIKLGLPVGIVMAHNGFAALLMLPLFAISFYSQYDLFEAELIPVEALSKEALTPAIETDTGIKKPVTDTLYLRLTSQLKKTRGGLGSVLTSLPLGQKGITDELLDDIEARLLLADIGVEATANIIHKLTDNLESHQLKDGAALLGALKQDLWDILKPCDQPLVIPVQDAPFVILVVGVNGAGKTTTIGKLAKKLQNQGYSVMLAAGDTFRAAAVEQLQVWGERNNVPVVAQQTGADSASVIFDALQSAKAKGIKVLIADTAGRLHTKSNLMEELAKIKRIMGKLDKDAPHEVLLVLDAGTGQNALSQAKLFNQTVPLTGLALTKLDGTAKGGVIFALAKQLAIPIRYIGIGESIDDLQNFNAKHFVDALFTTDE